MGDYYRRRLKLVLLFAALLWGGCWLGGSTARVKLDADRDRWELPHTSERVKLRWSARMKVRVELVNSSGRNMVVQKWRDSDNIADLDVSFYRGEELLWPSSTGCYPSYSGELLLPGKSMTHDINLNKYSSSGWPLPPGSYRLRLMYRQHESKREFPLLEKWVELEIK